MSTEQNETAVNTPEVKGENVIGMNDGRQVDFGKRGKLKKAIEIIGEGVERVIKLTVDVINGDTHVLLLNAEHPLFWELAAHGASQKITDSVTKAEDGDDISFGVANQIAQLNEGKWSVRAAGENLFRGFADLFEAIRRIKGYEIGSAEAEALKTSLAGASEEKIKNFKSNGQIKAIIAEIVAEKAAARAKKLNAQPVAEGDEDDLLADL